MTLQETDYGQFLAVLEEAQDALKAPMKERVAACMVVLPKAVERMAQIALYHTEIDDAFRALKVAVEVFLADVRKAQKMHPEVTYLSGQVRTGLNRVEEILQRMHRLHFQVK